MLTFSPFLSLLLSLTTQFHVAPMQGYTNAPLRHLLQKLAPNAILWTEMEKVVDLMAANSLHKRFGSCVDTKPFVIQLGGNDVDQMKECVERIVLDNTNDYRIRALDLNCGCPSIESGGASTFGASLMKQPELTRDLLRTLRDACPNESNIDISLKCRIAVLETPEDMVLLDDYYDELHNYVTHAVNGGISQLVLHARPVVLSGLSPAKNRSAPPLNYQIVDRIAADFPQLTVILNGGIQSLAAMQNVRRKYANIGGIMAGRWILRRPLDLVHIQKYLMMDDDGSIIDCAAATNNDDVDTIRLALSDYSTFLEQSLSTRNPAMYTLGELCMPLYLVLEQLREDDADDDDTIHTVLFETIQWLEESNSNNKKSKLTKDNATYKKMGASLKKLVGTKVFNKWKRNRAEL